MLPTTNQSAQRGPFGGEGSRRGHFLPEYNQSNSVLPEYIRRVLHFPQMDIDYTLWQMIYLCISPKRVYRMTVYRKQTKNQWSRDDPAFTAILLAFVSIVILSYAIAFQIGSFLGYIRVLVSTVFIDFLGSGALIATLSWWLCNKYFRAPAAHLPHMTDQPVEWMYAWDVHCNATFPLLLSFGVLQYILLPFLMGQNFIAAICSVCLYTFSLGYYFYVTFLGYNALPFLEPEKTIYYLYPMALLAVVALVSIFLGWNPTRTLMSYYYGG